MNERKAANGTASVEVLPDGRARVRAVIEGKRRQIGPIYGDEATAELNRAQIARTSTAPATTATPATPPAPTIEVQPFPGQ